MAWTAPVTHTTGTLITAAIWNAQVTDNMTFLGSSHAHAGAPGDGATIPGLIASGTILIFDAACPAGWTRVSAWDNKMLLGGSSYGATGGSDTHTHTGSSHSHSVTGHTHSGASHTHNYDHHYHNQNLGSTDSDELGTGKYAYATAVTVGTAMYSDSTTGALTRAIMGTGTDWSATGTTGAGNLDTGSQTQTAATGGTANTDAASTLPAYVDVIFCKKN